MQAAAHGLRIREIAVRLIYHDPNRSFGGPLDDPGSRLEHYVQTMHEELRRWAGRLPAEAMRGLAAPEDVDVATTPRGTCRFMS